MIAWRLAVAKLSAGLSTAATVRRVLSRSHGSTAADARTSSPDRDERSTSPSVTAGGSRDTRLSVARAARSSTLATMAADALSAPCAALGTVEHGIALLDGVCVALAREADELAVNGADVDAEVLTFLLADALDARDVLKGVQR